MINYTDQARAGVVLGGTSEPDPSLGNPWALYRRSNGDLWQKVEYEDGSLEWVLISTASGKAPPADLIAHRKWLSAPDASTFPAEWALNPGGRNDHAAVSINGITHAPTTDIRFRFRYHVRPIGGAPSKGAAFYVAAGEQFDDYLTGTTDVTYESTDLVDDTPQDFDDADVKPDEDEGSQYAVVAATDDPSEPAFIGWAAPGGISSALNVRKGPFADAEAGWANGDPTGDLTITNYAVKFPNVSFASEKRSGLADSDLALVLEAIEILDSGSWRDFVPGTDGTVSVNVGVQYSQ